VTGFSLLLPVYRGDSAPHFRRAFESSVAEQSLRPAEVVLVQDGPVSGELTLAIRAALAESPVPVNYVQIEQNSGLAHALNVGLEACAHEVVARMDADDISDPTRFERQLRLVDEGIELVGTGMVEFVEDEDGEETIIGRRVPPVGPGHIDRSARFHDPFNHPTVVYTKTAVARAGGYQPLGMMEDYWLFARMLASGAKVANLPDPLVKYRVSSGAYKRRGGLRLLRSELAIQRAFLRSGFTTPAQYARNVLVRGGYRLVPESARRAMYRRFLAVRSRPPKAGPAAG
jgi:glycosyltransferase involved in cell wall biosynthesis